MKPAAGSTRDTHRATAGIALVVVCALLVVVLLVLPGFFAAWFSRGDEMSYSMEGRAMWDLWLSPWRGGAGISAAKLYVLAPSGWVMEHSAAGRKFYRWEFRLAGGRETPPNMDDD